MPEIEKFVKSVQHRVNAGIFLRELLLALLICLLGMSGIAMWFVAFGHRVELLWLIIPIGISALILTVRFFSKRLDRQAAAAFADRFFVLKDSMITALEFAKEAKDGFKKLQLQIAGEKCPVSEVGKIKFGISKVFIIMAAMLTFLIVWLCLIPDAPAVQREKVVQRENLKNTAEIKKALEEQLEEIERSLTKEEKDLLAKSGIPQKIKKLPVTADRVEALRQYARLEQMLRELSERTRVAKNDQLLKQIAAELKRYPPASELAKMLAKKQYLAAAKKLSEMKPGKLEKPSDLNSAKSAADKLKDLAKRMQDAAKKQQGNQGKNSDSGDLSNSIQKLSESSSEYSGALDKAGKQLKIIGEMSAEDFKKMLEKMKKEGKSGRSVDSDLAILIKGLKSQDLKNKFLCKMSGLQQGLMKAQCGMGQCQGKGKGNGIGTGAANNTRNQNPNSDSNSGFKSQISGQLGSGPSRKKTEDTTSGGAVKHLDRTNARMIKYKRQAENFITREDVPENMKSGVKEYFKIIHNE